MTQKLFPKPPPAEPIPEKAWLRRTDRSDGKREPFFYGRDREYEVFQSAVVSLQEGQVGRGSVIYQGAPGAGKTALMHECMEAVRRQSTIDDPWVAVTIMPETLTSAPQVMWMILNTVNKESERLSHIAPQTVAGTFIEYVEQGKKLYQELSERGMGIGGISVGGKPKNNLDSNLLAQLVFTNAAPLLKRFHIVVFVDEAQSTPVKETTKGVMNCLHNPPENIPLVAAFFGLSDTKRIMRDCELSRPPDERVVNLEPLSMVDAKGSLRKIFDTYYDGSDDEKVYWSHELAKLSQGWPQHINRIGVSAGCVIRSNDGKMERSLLRQAIDKGIERKSAYYAERRDAGSHDPELYKQLAIAAAENKNGTLNRKQIGDIVSSELDQFQQSIDDFLTTVLHAGLLAPLANDAHQFRFPIPSMCDFLKTYPHDESNSEFCN